MRPHTVLLVAVVVTAGVLVLATWPQALMLHRFPVLAQLTALRGLLTAASLIIAVLVGVLVRKSTTRLRVGIVVIATLLLVAGVNSSLLVSRGLAVDGVQSGQAAEVTVFIWNMYRDGPDPELVADYALANAVDVIALLETSPAAAEAIRLHMNGAGRPMQVFVNTFDEVSHARSTVLLVSSTMGEYSVDDTVGSTPRVPAVVARPVAGDSPTLVAAHAAPPLPFIMADWNGGLHWLAERCLEPDVIIAGDFNATLDHFAGLRRPGLDVGACRDGAMALGSASVGTWPSQLPPWLSSPIDHVVASRDWEFVDFRVVMELDGRGSDHRALLAGLRRVQ